MKILWHMPTLRRSGCGLSVRAVQLAKRLRAFGHTITFVVCRPKTDITDGQMEGMPVVLLDIIGRPPVHWCLQAKARSAAAGLVVGMLDADHDLMISCQPEVVSAYAATRKRRPLLYFCGGTTLLHDRADQARQRSRSIPRRWPGAIDPYTPQGLVGWSEPLPDYSQAQ